MGSPLNAPITALGGHPFLAVSELHFLGFCLTCSLKVHVADASFISECCKSSRQLAYQIDKAKRESGVRFSFRTKIEQMQTTSES